MRNILAAVSIFGTITAIAACSVEVGEPMDSAAFDDLASIQQEASTCTNIAPDSTYTCAQQASWGKCNESWMVGKCDESCGRCSSSSGSTSTSCPNPDGTNAVMAALAVSAGTELKRWQPTKDFYLTNGKLALTSTGKSQCSDGKCFNTQALLDMQNDAASAVKFGGTTLNPSALRSRLSAKFGEQVTCESQPSNGGTSNCPVEDHKLTLQYSASGGCDTEYFYLATKTNGSALQYPAQLKNKLKWVDSTNPYVNFQHYGEIVSIDPTYGLNEAGSSSSGSCTAACTKISSSNIAGACCTCNGATKKYVRSTFSASVYLCQ